MENKKLFLTFLLILAAWIGLGTAQAAIAGAVVAWGDNSHGQTRVPAAAQSGVTAIAAGGAYTVALKSDGSVVAWGERYDGTNFITLSVPAGLSGVTAIAAGGSHTVALKDDGTVVAWGWNFYGQVTGIPSPENQPSSALANPVTLGGKVLTGVTAIRAGRLSTFAWKSDGSVVEWGLSQDVPGGWSGVTAIADGWNIAGWAHRAALKNDGTVVAWGANDYGQVTGISGVPLFIPAVANPVFLGGQVLSGVTAIAAGGHSTVALKDDGSVVEWGYTFPEVSAGLRGVTAIAAGAVHTVALKHDGMVVAWGNNIFGSTDVPSGLNGVTAIAAGRLHTVALLGTAVALQARRSGNPLVLSWPASATGFTLQSTPSLTPPVAWTDSGPPPVIVGAEFTVTNTNSGSVQFYRLRKP